MTQIKLRSDISVTLTMYEIEQVARSYEQTFAALFLLTHRAYVECGRVSP